MPQLNLEKEKEFNEDIEKHEDLNPAIFVDGHLKTEVREKALEITSEALKMMETSGFSIELKDIVIIGSNASYNYTKDSDLDLHLIANMDDIEDPEGLYPILFDLFKSAFNKKYEINFYDIPVGIYIEGSDTATVSNGIYSVLKDTWIQKPKKQNIPDIDTKLLNTELKPWVARYKRIRKIAAKKDFSDESLIENFINDLYKLRSTGLHKGGEYSIENLIFKEMRNKGYLHDLKQLKDEVITRRLTLESLQENATFDLGRIQQHIYRLTGIEPLVQPNGLFEIYRVSENQKNTLLGILRQQDFIEYITASPSEYYYSSYSPNLQAARYYKLTGKIK